MLFDIRLLNFSTHLNLFISRKQRHPKRNMLRTQQNPQFLNEKQQFDATSEWRFAWGSPHRVPHRHHVLHRHPLTRVTHLHVHGGTVGRVPQRWRSGSCHATGRRWGKEKQFGVDDVLLMIPKSGAFERANPEILKGIGQSKVFSTCFDTCCYGFFWGRGKAGGFRCLDMIYIFKIHRESWRGESVVVNSIDVKTKSLTRQKSSFVCKFGGIIQTCQLRT